MQRRPIGLWRLAFALAVWVSAVTAGAAAAERERDYVQLVTERRNYAYISAVVETFGTATRFKYPEILQTNAVASGRLVCSGVGLGFPDLAVVSETMGADETSLCRSNGVEGVTDIRIGFDTLVAVASRAPEDAPDGAARLALTSSQLFLALAAQIPGARGESGDGGGGLDFVANDRMRWSDIDGALPDQPIRILLPPRGANEFDLLLGTVFQAGCAAVPEVAAIRETDPEAYARLCSQIRDDAAVGTFDRPAGELAQRIALVEAGYGAVAGGSDPMLYQVYAEADPPLVLAFARPRVLTISSGLMAVAIDGRPPEEGVIARGDYPLARPVYLRVKTGQFALVPGLREFVSAFIAGEAIGEGGYLIDLGLTPVSAGERENMRLMLNAARAGGGRDGPADRTGVAALSPAARLRDIERKMWDRLRESEDPTAFDAFVEYFPDGIFAGRARRRAAVLRRRDSDQDGVADYLDRCAETREDIAVDADGCALDPQPQPEAEATQ